MSLWGRIKAFLGFAPAAPAAAPVNAPLPLITPAPVRADIATPSPALQSQPVILISGQSPNSKSVQAAVQSVIEQGGIPRLVTHHSARDLAKDMQGISGIMLLGNDYDTDPAVYGAAADPHTLSEKDPNLATKVAATKGRALTEEELNIIKNAPHRATYEEQLVQATLAQKIPLIGICGGLQRVNTALGGTLHQHIPDLIGNNSHMQTEGPSTPVQPVSLLKGGRLAALGEKIGVSHTYARTPGVHHGDVMENSFHHQAVATPGTGLRVSATYQDQVPYPGTSEKTSMIAALEVDPNGPLAGQSIQLVQWHPEFKASPLATELLADFVGTARTHMQQQGVMQQPEPASSVWQSRITEERARAAAAAQGLQSGQMQISR